MRQQTTRFLIILLCAVLLVSSLTLTAGAASEVVASGRYGGNITWSLDSSGTVTVSGTGAMEWIDQSNKFMEAEYNFWNEHKESFKTAIILDGVTSIGGTAFSGCINLTSVLIPDTVTEIYEMIFYGCTSLSSVTLPQRLTRINEGAFENCTSLTSLTLPASLQQLGMAAFANCTGLKSVTIPKELTVISWGVFEGCTGIKDVYYTGSEAEWNALDIREENDPLLTATVHYNWSPAKPGDANGDGAVNAKDVALLQRYVAKWSVDIDLDAADVNDDGVVNARDIALIQRKVAGWAVELK